MKIFFVILLLGAGIQTAIGQPSTVGTVFLYPQTITDKDPSTFKSISDTPKTETGVSMYDREAQEGKGAWISIDA